MEVTLEFIACSERLPEKSGKCVCLMRYGHIDTHFYSAKYKAFNVWDFNEPERAKKNTVNDSVCFWAYYPASIEEE